MSTLPHRLTPEEYLAIERHAEFKSEYFHGQMFAMSGGSREHSALAFRFASLIGGAVESCGCEGHTGDMRLLVESSGLITYTDGMVICGPPSFADARRDVVTNPTLILEVLSPSTERYDRGEKLWHYRTIPSLRECLLARQDAPDVEFYQREAGNSWHLIDARGWDAWIELGSIGYTLRLRDLYRGILSET